MIINRSIEKSEDDSYWLGFYASRLIALYGRPCSALQGNRERALGGRPERR